MKLYHGTREGTLPLILSSGLMPRKEKKGNWSHTVSSNPGAVYLTNSYAIHFAQSAVKSSKDRLLLIEVETDRMDQALFAPDEDFLEQGTREHPEFTHITDPASGWDMKKRTLWFRKRALSEFAGAWEQSLEKMGTCCFYGTITPAAITRYALIPITHRLTRMSDPTITILNYQILGGYYRQYTRYIFGDQVDMEDVKPIDLGLEKIMQIGREEIEVHKT